MPKEQQERRQYANQVGADGWMLLKALQAPTTPDWMKTLPAVTPLRLIWEQPFEPLDQGGHWRQEPALPATELITSPYEPRRAPCQEKNDLLDGLQGPFHPDLR